jgi:hypothetical protein
VNRITPTDVSAARLVPVAVGINVGRHATPAAIRSTVSNLPALSGGLLFRHTSFRDGEHLLETRPGVRQVCRSAWLRLGAKSRTVLGLESITPAPGRRSNSPCSAPAAVSRTRDRRSVGYTIDPERDRRCTGLLAALMRHRSGLGPTYGSPHRRRRLS